MNNYYVGSACPKYIFVLLLCILLIVEYRGKSEANPLQNPKSSPTLNLCDWNDRTKEVNCKEAKTGNTNYQCTLSNQNCTMKLQCSGNTCLLTDVNLNSEFRCSALRSCRLLNCLKPPSAVLDCCQSSTITKCLQGSTNAPTTTSSTIHISTKTKLTTPDSNHNQNSNGSTHLNILSEQKDDNKMSLIIGLTVSLVATSIIVIVVLIVVWRNKAEKKSGAKNTLSLKSPVYQQYDSDIKQIGNPNLDNNHKETNGHIYNEVYPEVTENYPYTQLSTNSSLTTTNQSDVKHALFLDTQIQSPNISLYTLARIPSDTKTQQAENTVSYFLLNEVNNEVSRNSVGEDGVGVVNYFILEKEEQYKSEKSDDTNTKPEIEGYSKLFETVRQANFPRNSVTSKYSLDSIDQKILVKDRDSNDYTETINNLGNDTAGVHYEGEKNSKECQENVHGDGNFTDESNSYSKLRENTKELRNDYNNLTEVPENMNNDTSKELVHQRLNADKTSDYSLSKLF